MEYEGIYYFFEYVLGWYILVLCDDIIVLYGVLFGGEFIFFYFLEKVVVGDQENIYVWQLEQEIKLGCYYIDDYDFKKFWVELFYMCCDLLGYVYDGYEIYEWLGGYMEYGDGDVYICV